jgi:hypothetical protein
VNEVALGTLVSLSLEGADFVRPIGIIHRRGKELSSTVKRFMDLLQSTSGPAAPIADSTHRLNRVDGADTDSTMSVVADSSDAT